MSEKPTNSTAAPQPPSAPSPPPRPAAAPPAKSRRKLLTLFAVVGGLLALAPWVPFGTFLSSSSSVSSVATTNQTIVLDENTEENGGASGKTVNVNDLNTFP